MKRFKNRVQLRKMKRWQKVIGVVCLGLMASLGIFLMLKDEGIIAKNQLLRFHVIANSDSEIDQNVKLKVRDAVLAYLNPVLMETGSEKEAYAYVAAHADDMDKIAEDVLAANGFDYQAQVKLGKSQFPTKAYGELVLPAGTYQALRIELGEAQGKNWWCVLFPPLCYVNIGEGIAVATTEHEGILTTEDGDVVTAGAEPQKTEIKLKLLEVFE